MSGETVERRTRRQQDRYHLAGDSAIHADVEAEC